ncbi:DNA cytosine methyltransferase [Bacteroidota bacterium]
MKKALNKSKHWVLIGGPPCQAYSLVGRSRVGGIAEDDHRVYLYREYLRIIAMHHPTVFIMENVKGLLSAKVNGEKVFDKILQDLKEPGLVYYKSNSPKYKIYSLVKPLQSLDNYNNPTYEDDKDYLIESDKYGIPQKRHRVILLGIREDIKVIPDVLQKHNTTVTIKDVIEDLPKIRSGISRSFESSEFIDGKKRRYYKKEIDSDICWEKYLNDFRNEIISWNGFAKDYGHKSVIAPVKGVGAEFIKCKTPSKKNPLYEWYIDANINGTCNHESRSHLLQDLKRYMFSSIYAKTYNRFPRLQDFESHSEALLPDHKNATSGKFNDRFRVQLADEPATTVTSHISKDGHYFIHYDPDQCRSLTVREAARIQTFPDNYLFCGPRTAQFHQVGNAVPPYLAKQIAQKIFELLKHSSY